MRRRKSWQLSVLGYIILAMLSHTTFFCHWLIAAEQLGVEILPIFLIIVATLYIIDGIFLFLALAVIALISRNIKTFLEAMYVGVFWGPLVISDAYNRNPSSR